VQEGAERIHKRNTKEKEGKLMIKQDERTYCQECAGNYDDDGFDYRFEYPVCRRCVELYKLTPEKESKLMKLCLSCGCNYESNNFLFCNTCEGVKAMIDNNAEVIVGFNPIIEKYIEAIKEAK
jgi:hypothetical protein